MAVFRAQLQWIKDKGTGDTQVIDNWNTINIRLSSELKNNMMTISLQNDFNSRKPRIYNSPSSSNARIGHSICLIALDGLIIEAMTLMHLMGRDGLLL